MNQETANISRALSVCDDIHQLMLVRALTSLTEAPEKVGSLLCVACDPTNDASVEGRRRAVRVQKFPVHLLTSCSCLSSM